MRLILVRHAKAKDRKKWIHQDDLKRPLTKRGVQQAKKIAKYISKKYPNVDAVITSLAFRVRDTAEYIVKEQASCTLLLTSDLNPEKEIDGFLKNQEKLEGEHQTLVVVGHEPGISEFVRLVCAKGSLNLCVGKGCVVELEYKKENDWFLVGLNNF